jgi:hypothetical protein
MKKPTLSIALAKKIRETCESLKASFEAELVKSGPEYDWYTEGPDQLEKFAELLSEKLTRLRSAAGFEEDSIPLKNEEAQRLSYLIEATEAIQRCIRYADQAFVNFEK